MSARRKAEIDKNRSKRSRFKSLVFFGTCSGRGRFGIPKFLAPKNPTGSTTAWTAHQLTSCFRDTKLKICPPWLRANRKNHGNWKACINWWKPWKLASANIKSRILKLCYLFVHIINMTFWTLQDHMVMFCHSLQCCHCAKTLPGAPTSLWVKDPWRSAKARLFL